MSMIEEEAGIWNIPETPDDMAQAARRTVAANATSTADARELLAMLGLIETGVEAEETLLQCSACSAPMVNRRGSDLRARPDGVKTVGAKGMCNWCYQKTLRTDVEVSV